MSNKNSLLEPVGTVSRVPDLEGRAIGICLVDLSLAPVGSELYVQPKDSRLKLEVQVANDNALHWRDGLIEANNRCAELRTELYRCRDLMRKAYALVNQNNVDPRTPTIGEKLGGLMESIRKELERK